MKKKFLLMLIVLAFGAVNVAKAEFQVFVHTLHTSNLPRVTPLFVDYPTTVENMKAMLATTWGIRPEQIILIFAGRPLDDYRTVADLNIQKEAILHAVYRAGARELEETTTERTFTGRIKALWNSIFS